MRIIIAIAEKTVPLNKMGVGYWKFLQEIRGKKTHIKILKTVKEE